MKKNLFISSTFLIPPGLEQREVLAPNSRIGHARGLSVQSLSGLATRSVHTLGLRVISNIGALVLIRSELEESGYPDAEHFCKEALATVNALFRAGLEDTHLQSCDSGRAKLWCTIALRFRERLLGMQLLLSSDVYRFALEGDIESKPYCVVGYPRLSELEAQWIERCTCDGAEVYLPDNGHSICEENRERARWFETQGWTVEQRDDDGQTSGVLVASRWGHETSNAAPNVTVLQVHNQEKEIRTALKQVKRWIANGIPLAQIVLVVRNEPQYGGLLSRIAKEYRVPVRLQYQTTVSQTRFGRWLSHWMNMIQSGFGYEATVSYLLHPYSSRLITPALRETMRKTFIDGEDTWIDLLPELKELLPPEALSPDEWIAWFTDAIERLMIPAKAAHSARESHACQRFVDSLQEWKVWVDPHPLRWFEVARQWREVLANTTVPFAPGRGGVALHTPLALYGNQFTHGIVLGMVEGEMPPAIRDDTVLDDFTRDVLVRAGLPVERATERSQREALSFWAMIHAITGEIHFFVPQTIGQKETLPSSYLDELSLHPEIRTDASVASVAEKRQTLFHDPAETQDPVLVHARNTHTVELSREQSPEYDIYDGVIGKAIDAEARVFSPSQLTTFGQCPFRWFMTYGFRLKEPDEYVPDLDPARKGSLCHAVLCSLLDQCKEADDVRASMLENLEAVFDACAEEKSIQTLPGWGALRNETLQQLRVAIRSNDFIGEGDAPSHLEHQIEGQWRGLSVRGIVDRIDKTPDGWRVIDYKTASQPPKGAESSSGRADLDIQLNLYSHVIAEMLSAESTEVTAEYFLIPKGKAKAPKPKDESEYVTFVERLQSSLKSGYFPVAPDRDEAACTYCPHEAICRKGPRLQHKERSR